MPIQPIHRHPARQRGVSLLEAMIAFAVISVGLLGIAKMQALAINSTRNASSRSVAAVAGASLSSMMSVNRAYWGSGLAPASMSVSGATISDPSLTAAQGADCTSGPCSPAQMAAWDLTAWGSMTKSLMPGGQGTIACSTGVGNPVTCSIQISWQEKLVAMNAATQSAANSATTQTFVLLTQP